MQSNEELAHYFVNQIVQPRFGHEGRIGSALSAIPELVAKGWTLDGIKNEVDLFAQQYPEAVRNIYHIGEIMNQKQPPNNLMERDVFYYHNKLRITSPPVRVRQNEAGEMVRESSPFFLEMKSNFTLNDLLNYWYQQMNITPSDHMIKQDEGKFKYILTNYTLDEVLFSIDAARSIRKDRQLRPLRNAFELDKYIEDARELIKGKENVHKVQGINREVKRHDAYTTESNFY
jgi:hypothetical protein